MGATDVEVDVLGATSLRVDGTRVELSAQRQRSLLALLTLARGQLVSADRLIDQLWRGAPSPGAANTLQGYVASLRRLLEPHRRPRSPAEVLVHEAGGYRLSVPRDQVDAERFAATVARAEKELRAHGDLGRPSVGADHGTAERVQQELLTALALWRGEAYADLDEESAAAGERRRLEELRTDADTLVVVTDLALGRARRAAGALEELVALHPLREQLWALWAVALVRTDRQADALALLARLRETLGEELGIDPSPSVQRLQADILRQDPALLGTGGGPGDRPPAPSAPVRAGGLVGRGRELATLRTLLATALAGRPAHAVVAGEAGIGKSRLVAELVEQVSAGPGAPAVATLRGVDGDDAPPLYALTRVVDELCVAADVTRPVDPGPAATAPPDGDEDEVGAARFAQTARLADAVRGLVRHTPLLLVVEDAHWCDPATLRVLTHLVDHLADVPLALVVTHRPEGAAAVSGLVGAVARSGGAELHLERLAPGEVADLARAVTGHELDAVALARLDERAGGHPLYVVELLRAGDPAAADPPPSLAGLVRRRLAALPQDTAEALRFAAVAGVRFDAEVVARAWGTPVLETSDALALAGTAGVLVRTDDGEWSWSHALVRDAVLADLRPADLSGRHAAVAEALEATIDPVRRAAAAAHWRAAGTAYAARAWRSTSATAERARRVFAHDDEARLLRDALAAHRLDVEGDDDQRFDLLERLAAACRHADDWDGAALAVTEAIAVAERMDRPDLVARAATSLPEGSIWHVQRYGTVAADLVHALRRSLGLVDPADRALRCRILLSIAVQSFYIASPDELEALTDAALALADQLDDDALTCVALQQAYSACWRPATAAWRLEAAERALLLARSGGHVRHEVTCATFRAISLVETGQVERARAELPRTLALAEQHGQVTPLVTLLLLHTPLLLMAGRDAEADRALAQVHELRERLTMSNLTSAAASLQLLRMTWRGETEAFAAALGHLEGHPEVPLEMLVAVAMLRLGLDDAAEALLSSFPVPDPDETYMGMVVAAMSAELALRRGDADLAARAYRWLAPYAGQMAAAGSTAALGPVDAFLALAAAASGRTPEAAAHAEAALALCAQWGLPRPARWLLGLREQHVF
ncbi:AAA family ATPase [Nocardioides anomalus]|uniref:AAA family ATPase n=1 Tax=Nocardioides anomalus TaxID=2712223 RepID=A0A6G6W949_9ACTN|nr:BTAD domain-containing putative transcriptional regulator [Nocardioides anomalus]QIG41868.1 AAA family ATPase [Nocardioides anomalus]